jgi:hypothetical protein
MNNSSVVFIVSLRFLGLFRLFRLVVVIDVFYNKIPVKPCSAAL